jgi:hypothetical protein
MYTGEHTRHADRKVSRSGRVLLGILALAEPALNGENNRGPFRTKSR